MKIIDIRPDDARLTGEILPVLSELRPHLTGELLTGIYREGYGQGLRYTAAYTGDGHCAGVAGWRVIVCTSSGRRMYVDDLVTASGGRSAGVGHALLAHLEERARELGCHELTLDSGTQRHRAHRFYLRERMDIHAFHFTKPLGPVS